MLMKCIFLKLKSLAGDKGVTCKQIYIVRIPDILTIHSPAEIYTQLLGVFQREVMTGAKSNCLKKVS